MEFLFTLNLSYQDFLPYYQGIADKVAIRDTQGRILWISGRHFRTFLTPQGIHGSFTLVIDEQGKLRSLTRA
ncbi:MAG: DUF2835 domain-containing protein [Shewanella sp.]